jgi:hypothetical protein
VEIVFLYFRKIEKVFPSGPSQDVKKSKSFFFKLKSDIEKSSRFHFPLSNFYSLKDYNLENKIKFYVLRCDLCMRV